MTETMRKVWLAAAMATTAFNLLAGTAIAAGATDDTGTGRATAAALMIVGGAVMALGLATRNDAPRRRNTLIALGAVPALLWFWYLVPALLAIAVIAGAVGENRRLSHRGARGHDRTTFLA